jgi:hypothetical protein
MKGRIMEIKALFEKLPEAAIQRTKKSDTRKAYDTDGYGYQYCVNRFNEIAGDKWGFDWKIFKEVEGNFSQSGKAYYDITVDCLIWIDSPANQRHCVGGHISGNYADALKGAITNAFKKTAAFWGVGRHAYEGSIDDDNQPYPEELKAAMPQQIIIKGKNEPTKPKGNLGAAKNAILNANTNDALNNIKNRVQLSSWTDLEVAEIMTMITDKLSSLVQEGFKNEFGTNGN